jgi:hypothetical protein
MQQANRSDDMNDVATTSQSFDLSPRNFDEAWRMAEILADSDMVPRDFKGKPGNCLVAMQWGSEVGLKALQALQNIAVINGRPALWGDAVIALVRGSPLCEFVIETDDGSTATCRVKRRGEPEQAKTFGMDDAKTAGLLGKAGPWTQYPKRMRQMRARAFALRDVFPDVLRGMAVAEELIDLHGAPKEMGPADVVQSPAAPPPAIPPTWPAESFAAQLPRWTKAVETGMKTVADIEALATSKGALTAEQLATIRALRQPEPAAEDDTFVADIKAAEGAAQ